MSLAATAQETAPASADFTLADFPAKAARWWPRRAAFIDPARATSYRELHDRVNRLVTVLRDAKVAPQSRVGVLSGNSMAYFEVFFACARLGAVMTPINVRLSPREVAYQIGDADMSCVVLGRAQRELAERARLTGLTHWWLDDSYETAISSATPDASRTVFPADTPHTQMYTSGTTGYAKGCVHSQGGWRASALNLALGTRLDRRPVLLAQSPFFHGWGFGCALSHLLVGGTVVIPAEGTNKEYWRLLDDHQVTSVNVPRGAPPESRPRPHVTALLNQAGYFRPSHKALMESIFPRAEVYGAYGMTELTNITMMSRSGEEIAHPGTLGEVFPGLDAQVTDDDGRPVKPGAIGELVFRGAQVCLGYHKNPEATAALFRDGWLRTGDLVRADEDGRLYFVDRAKDMIKSGGENVYSVEVEQVLLRFPGVMDAAVFGVPDQRWGEAVKAVIAVTPGTEPDLNGIDAFCLDNLAAYKRPRWYQFVPEITRSATGKLLKNQLREQHENATSIRLEERSS